MGYNLAVQRMYEIRETDEYRDWYTHLRDQRARLRITARIRRASLGNLGDFRSVGPGVSELRIAYGPGYRIYFTRRGSAVIVLLAGGDKSTQAHDIERARALAGRV